MLIRFLFLLCCLSLTAQADLSREEAKDVLLAVVGNVGTDRDIAVYLTASPLTAGSSVAPFITPAGPTILAADTWFGWIDDEPSAFFAHPTRFVYIRASDGQVTVVNHQWWPEVNDDPPFSEEDIEADPSLVLISTLRELDPDVPE